MKVTTVILLFIVGLVKIPSALSDPSASPHIFRIKSKILGEERVVWVSLPQNYALAKQRYPVIYLLDGNDRALFDLTVGAAGYDLFLDAYDHALPEEIVIGIGQKDRGNDFGKNAANFYRFLVEEVVPFIERTFRTTPYRTLIGHSLAGRFALRALCRGPSRFSGCHCHQPGDSECSSAQRDYRWPISMVSECSDTGAATGTVLR